MNAIKIVFKTYSLKATILMLCLCGFSLYVFNVHYIVHPAYSELDTRDLSYKMHFVDVQNFYKHRQLWIFSKLGAILFKGEDIPHLNSNENKTFTILIWKYWDWLKKRHVYYNKSNRSRENVNILENCSVKNCIFSGDSKLMNIADAVVIHLQKGLIPRVNNRNPKQRWIFLNDESPKNAFSLAKRRLSSEELHNVFNWSMTYRTDADVPVPYGRTIPLKEPLRASLITTDISTLVPNWENKTRDVPATLLMSNCNVKERNSFLKNLTKYIKVDVYGGCSDNEQFKKRCPGHFTSDCEVISKYLFYLALENSNCFQYITEKVFYNAYTKGAVPVIWGPSHEDVETLLPPNSYLYADERTNVKQLAQNILNLAENDDLLLAMHMWRNHFKVVNEHGFFASKSYHLCRLCEAMNYNDEAEKLYKTDDLKYYLDPSLTCKKI